MRIHSLNKDDDDDIHSNSVRVSKDDDDDDNIHSNSVGVSMTFP